LHSELQKESEKHAVTLEPVDVISQFKYLIRNVHNKTGGKAVVIVDEYDKPLPGTIDDPQLHARMKDELKGFYGVLKSYDEYLRFVFLTGVTKFSHLSIKTLTPSVSTTFATEYFFV